MERVFVRKSIIFLLLAIFIFTSIFTENVFAEGEESFQFDIFHIKINAGGNSKITLSAIGDDSGSVINIVSLNGNIDSGRASLTEGTEVIITVENDDWGGKAIYDEYEELSVTMSHFLGNEIEQAKVKEFLDMDSLSMKDYLEDDGKTFKIKFILGKEFKDYVNYEDEYGSSMNSNIRIDIKFPISYRGEIIPTAFVGENQIYDEDIIFTGENDGYVYDSETNRHFVKGSQDTNFKVSFPGEYVFDTWKFVDFNIVTPIGRRPVGLKTPKDVENNPITIIPNLAIPALNNLDNIINLQAVLKNSPKVTFDPNFEELESKEIQTNSGKVVLPNKSDFSREEFIVNSWNTQAYGEGNTITSGEEIQDDMTVYAQWIGRGNAVFVVPDLNYENIKLEEITTTINGTISLPQDPTREDHKFLGWFDKVTGGNKVTSATTFTKDTIIYAQWQPIDYVKLKFLVNNEEHTSFTIDKELKLGNQLPEIKTPIDGYYFRGWFTEKDGKGTKLSSETNFSSESGERKDIYAYLLKRQSEGNVYGIIYVGFNYKHSNGSQTMSKPQNNITGELEWFVPTPPSEGLIFKGWYTTEKSGEKVEEGTIFLKETRLYAQWRKENIKVDFDLNGGEGSIPSVQADIDGKIILPTEVPKRSGYKFIGWFDSNESGSPITENTIFDDDVTIYAQWEKVSEQELDIIYVGLKKDDKLVARGKIKGTNITLLVDLSSEQLRSGDYTLIIRSSERTEVGQEGGSKGGWYDGYINMIGIDSPTKFTVYGDNGETKEYTLTIKRDIKEPETYTVIFNTNGGSTINPVPVKDGGKVPKPANPIKSGYKFAGWYRDVLFRYEFDFTTPINDDRELFAKWEENQTVQNEFTVSFSSNGGSSVSSQKVLEGKTAIQPKDPIRSGYTFVNWYTESNLNYVFSFNTAINKDITLYAKWQENYDGTPNTVQQGPRITRFSILGHSGIIDDKNKIIIVNLPKDYDLNEIVPSISTSGTTTISPDRKTAMNFYEPVYYMLYGGYGYTTYKVIVNTPSNIHTEYFEDYYNDSSDDYFSNYKKTRDDYYKKRAEISWWDLAKEAKEKRAEEELKAETKEDEKLILNEKKIILNNVGNITASIGNDKGSISVKEHNDYIEMKPTATNFQPGFSNKLNIPKGVLSTLPNGNYESLRYDTGVVNIEIYPFMETASGLKLNLCDVPKDIRATWNKIEGKGYIFQVEANSTKAGLSYELNLEKRYPAEKLRFVKYDYMKSGFEDVSLEKWYVLGGKLRCDKVSAGIYGIIYKD